MYEKYPIVLATAAFIVNSTHEFLVVKKSKNELIDPGLWVVPGGKVLPEEPIVISLHREVQEETGLEVASYKWIGEDVFISGNRYFHAQHFMCTVKTTKPIVLESKLESYAWITKEDLTKYEMPDNLKNRMLEIYSGTHGL